jgi:hypothetical protein
MPRPSAFRAGIVACAALITAACQDNAPPTSPGSMPVTSSAQGTGLPSAAEFDRVTPGFGGYYLNQDGTPTVYLTRGASRAPAEQALAGYLAARGLSTAAVHVLEAQYSWKQLERYQAASADALAVPGAVFVDNDETRNRVVLGVSDMAAAAEARATAVRAGVPDGAIVIQQTEPILNMANLQNVVDRPVRAGVQINFPGFLCSVGFNATSGTQKSFITASHCTTTQGGVESTPYWQPLESVNSTQIATEVADPVYVRKSPGCPRGKRCRASDASRAAYINGADQALGLIAMTSAPNNRSLDIIGSFSITSDDCTGTLGGCLPVGATVNKVGRTTGWTSGAITNTCVTTGVTGSSVALLCQTFVSAGVGSGDSGSDVFQVTSSTNVKLAGILWGGNQAGTQFVFSPLANVVSELGALTTH